MFRQFKERVVFYKRWCKHYVMYAFALKIMRVIAFPIMLYIRLYQWVYGYDDEWN